MIKNVKAVIFDMDGLMVDSERLGRLGWLEAGQKWGYPLTDKEYALVTGRTVRDAVDIFKGIFGDDFPFYEMRDHRVKYEHEYYSKNGIPLKPGLLELLDFLEANKIPKIVATSAGRKAAIDKLTLGNIIGRFQEVCTSDQIENGKPAPDIFLLAAERLQIPPQNCIVLEDSEAGVKGAKAAGAIPIMVPDLKPPSEEAKENAFRIVKTLHDVIDIFSTEILSDKR